MTPRAAPLLMLLLLLAGLAACGVDGAPTAPGRDAPSGLFRD